MKKFFKNHWVIIAIFLLAFFLRVYRLGSMPLGLHEDEVMNGYVGRYILQNGKDLYGNRWPLLYFDNFGDYPNVIPMYLSGISTYLFGINDFAIRFPIALAGALTVIPIYLIGEKVFSQKKYALWSAFFLAVLPWHIILSRSTAENVTATFIYLFVLYFILFFLKGKNKITLALAVFFGFCTYFLYPSYRVVIPLTFLTASIFVLQQRKKFLALILTGCCFLGITFLISRTVWGQGRFHQTSIFYFNGMVEHRLQTYSFGIGAGHTLEARLFYNKPVGFAREFVHQYLTYFSPTFLMTDAGKPDRYRLSDTGIMYATFLAIVILGLGIKLFGRQHKDTVFARFGLSNFLFLLMMLAISAIPAALTLDDIPNIHRALPIGILIIFFVVFCLAQIENLTRFKKTVYVALAVFFLLESVYFWHQWMAFGPVDQAPFRDQGRTPLALYLIANHQQYDNIFLSKNAKVLYYLFYTHNFDPRLAGSFSFNIFLPKVDNLNFVNENCVGDVPDLPVTTRSLVVESPDCSPKIDYHLKKIGMISRVDTQIAFDLLVATQSAQRK